MWRWENVPRSTSWPVRRIGVPSVRSEAKASCSACAQSIPPSAPSASRRRSSCLTSFGWTVKPSGTLQQLVVQRAQPVGRHRRLHLGRGRAVELVLAGGAARPPRRPRARALSAWCRLVSSLPDLLLELVGLLLGDRPLLGQPLGEELAHARVRLDLRVHLGLRVGGLVGLVVAVAAVADQVDQHVVAELLAEGEGQPHGGDARGDVVGVDVDDRDVEALGEVRRPLGRARLVAGRS